MHFTDCVCTGLKWDIWSKTGEPQIQKMSVSQATRETIFNYDPDMNDKRHVSYMYVFAHVCVFMHVYRVTAGIQLCLNSCVWTVNP